MSTLMSSSVGVPHKPAYDAVQMDDSLVVATAAPSIPVDVADDTLEGEKYPLSTWSHSLRSSV